MKLRIKLYMLWNKEFLHTMDIILTFPRVYKQGSTFLSAFFSLGLHRSLGGFDGAAGKPSKPGAPNVAQTARNRHQTLVQLLKISTALHRSLTLTMQLKWRNFSKYRSDSCVCQRTVHLPSLSVSRKSNNVVVVMKKEKKATGKDYSSLDPGECRTVLYGFSRETIIMTHGSTNSSMLGANLL